RMQLGKRFMTIALRAARPTADCETAGDAGSQAGLHAYLDKLAPHGIRQAFARGETILSEGDAAGRIYRIVAGTVRICKHTADGRRHIVDFMFPGELLGIVEDEQHGFTAEAVTDAVIESFPRARLDQIGRFDPAVGNELRAHHYDNLLTMQMHLLVLGCQDAKERLASFLLRLARRTGVHNGGLLEVAMGRQDIADHLGLTIETICRAIRDLKTQGAIATPNTHQFVLTNLPALRALAIAN
ncbi:MAG TPA: helix-turn-helix domain-containing protein, partial [Rhizomicrobium sp.]|nr:helix-turn-helix domain-containing protein [Rhizomicrobium sp.]